MFGGLSIFVGAFFYSKKYEVVVPPTIIAYATQAPFILGDVLSGDIFFYTSKDGLCHRIGGNKLRYSILFMGPRSMLIF